MALTQVLMLVRTSNCAVFDTQFRPSAYLPVATLVEVTVDGDRPPKQPEELVQIKVPGWTKAAGPQGHGQTRWGYLEPLRERARSRLERLVGPDTV